VGGVVCIGAGTAAFFLSPQEKQTPMMATTVIWHGVRVGVLEGWSFAHESDRLRILSPEGSPARVVLERPRAVGKDVTPQQIADSTGGKMWTSFHGDLLVTFNPGVHQNLRSLEFIVFVDEQMVRGILIYGKGRRGLQVGREGFVIVNTIGYRVPPPSWVPEVEIPQRAPRKEGPYTMRKNRNRPASMLSGVEPRGLNQDQLLWQVREFHSA
jgi:hypothetical protein